MFKSALFILFITTFLLYGQAIPPTAVFYGGNVYSLSVLQSDIVVEREDTSFASFSVRKKGDIKSVGLYIKNADGRESALYAKNNGRNVALTTSKVGSVRQLGDSFSLLLPSRVYTYHNGVERLISIESLGNIVVRAFYNDNVYLDNPLNFSVQLTEYTAPKIEILNVSLSKTTENVYSITLKYSGGENKNISFYYRAGYESRVYNIIEPLITYNQTNATSIVLKNTFNNGIGKEYIVQVYFKANSVEQHLFFNAFDEKGQTSTIPLQVILEPVKNIAPITTAPSINETNVVVATQDTDVRDTVAQSVVEDVRTEETSEVATPVVVATTPVVPTATPRPTPTQNTRTRAQNVAAAPVVVEPEPIVTAPPAVTETPIVNIIEEIEENENIAPVINIMGDEEIVPVVNLIEDDVDEVSENIEESDDEIFVIKNDDIFNKEYLTRQNFIDFPKRIIDTLAENSGNSLDVVFVLDVTASMKMALDTVKRHVDEIIVQMYERYDIVRVGFVQFRDVDDDFFVKSSGYITDKYDIKRLVYSLYASGGGDLPEPILDAMDSALTDYRFESDTRQMFVITDAPIKKSIYTTEKSVMERIKSRNIDLKYFVLPVMK